MDREKTEARRIGLETLSNVNQIWRMSGGNSFTILPDARNAGSAGPMVEDAYLAIVDRVLRLALGEESRRSS